MVSSGSEDGLSPDSTPSSRRRRSRWIDIGLSVALLLIAALVLAPLAGALLGNDDLPPAGPPSGRGLGAQTQGPQPVSPTGPACAAGSLIGTLATERAAARISPSSSAPSIASFARITKLGSPQVFLLKEQLLGRDGVTWFRALLPVRPNGTSGFLRGTDIHVRTTPYRLVLDRRRFRLRLYRGCDLVKTVRVGIGTGKTPTPVGQFYLTSLIKLPDPGTLYGPYAYGLSGYSEVLEWWKFGGIIGLHGTDDPSSIGKRSSHGCIRMRNRDIRALVKLLPLGTPIVIH